MLAMSDRHGEIHTSIPGLAKRAGISLQECEAAINCLKSPDAYSRTKDHDGRRIAEIDGGFLLLNHGKYRSLLSVEERREYNRKKQQEYRANKKPVSKLSANVSSSVAECTHAEAEAEAEATKPKRQRNPLMDWLAQMGGAKLDEVTPTAWSGIRKVLTEIQSVTPDVTADELARRAKNLELKWKFQPTATALAKHWADANNMPEAQRNQQQPFSERQKPAWLQIKELEARIESHVANHNRLGYDSSRSTPEAKEEWKRLKQTLKDLQAGQPCSNEEEIP